MAGSALDRVRAICLALPDTSERPSHGTPHGGLDWDEIAGVIETAHRTIAATGEGRGRNKSLARSAGEYRRSRGGGETAADQR